MQTAQARPGVAVCAPRAHHPRGDSTRSPPHTHPKQPPAPSREHCRAAVGISKRAPPAAGASAGAGACGRRTSGPSVLAATKQGARSGAGAAGTARRGLGATPRRQPPPPSKPNNPRRKSTPTASQEPDIRKKMMAPVEAGELEFVFLPARLRE